MIGIEAKKLLAEQIATALQNKLGGDRVVVDTSGNLIFTLNDIVYENHIEMVQSKIVQFIAENFPNARTDIRLSFRVPYSIYYYKTIELGRAAK